CARRRGFGGLDSW
nr:immunoglobulin heavy chain junction region [Macaca mulatta]MOV53845.1 immunoglobulin heavy chain junction region [Macaca mulatta]MOV54231.1 immunoglobulin heavy chain junction region [Macaca mulatta]MOV56163.1 immunoglobulin heavy chain junction region [Macaca mulatta]MOV58214.1 immunoglobulin heavy chain junction region [Macaca mulatta]